MSFSEASASDVANSIEGRLLCASEVAYGVRQPYFGGVGFMPHTQAKKISKGVNSVLVGQLMEGDIVVAFRGTRTSSPLDWLQNAALSLKSIPGIPGRIHSGFYGATKALYDPLRKILLEMLASAPKAAKIYLTGHSKGGSLASIAALLMQNDATLPNASYVCTFAQARIGNADFARHYNSKVSRHTAYENDLDLIPFLPPASRTMDAMDLNMTEMVDDIMWSPDERRKHENYRQWDYQPVGERKYINSEGRIETKITRDLDDQRVRAMEQKTLLSFKEFRAAHCLSCPQADGTCKGGYSAAIAPEICETIPTEAQALN